ncbi:MAG TPA: SusF/SusE family outer membrane protein, partial [Chitinophagaceae bacterium]|nr:SusF/SusE family outer membrane protein [Chitinophagaceae bacterium]
SNAITVNVNTYIPFYNMYLVGDFNGWDAANAPELISDRTPGRWGKVFFSYVRMSAGNKFLFLHKRGAWETKHGATGGSGEVYDIGDQNTGADFQVAATGIYRITIDLDAKKAYVQLKQVGVVGNMQGWNPASPIYGGYLRKDHFLIITPSNNDGFKFHDGPEWNNSTPDKARWYGPAGNGLLTYDGSGSDIIASGNPRSRVIWNGTDPQQLKYEVSPANEMRVVGDGIDEVGVGEWSPGTSPQMTYSGNGVWTITIKLKADKSIKFLAGNDWGAFDYEDAGTGAVVVGTPRAIKWDGGPDFKTPAVAGTYTITLNEHTGTVTISN